MIGVFLSYSRGDDEAFVRQLSERLKEATSPDGQLFDVWFDRDSMPSRSLTFHQEIRDAINARERLILVVGPKAITSDYVTQEWQFAYFAADKCVNPIVRLDGYDERRNRVDGYSLIPEDLRLLHAEDFRDNAQFNKHLDNLIRQLSESVPSVGTLVDVPELPPTYRAQPDRIKALRDLLLPDLHQPVVITGAAARVGVMGMGGIGKSVLASALAHDPQVRRAFQDAIYWIKIGQQPHLEELQRRLADDLGDAAGFNNLHEGKKELRKLLNDRAALLILDDVWERNHAEAFDVAGARCRILLTTRDAGLVGVLAGKGNHYRVELPSSNEAQAILGSAVEIPPDQLPPEAAAIIEECGRLPLALALCGGMIKAGITWPVVLAALRNHDLEYLSNEHPDPNDSHHENAWKAMDISLRVLPADDQKRFAELAVFGADTGAPDAAVATLWQHTAGLSPQECDSLLAKFSNRSLIQRRHTADDRTATSVDLHDLVRHFATGMADRQYGSITALHQDLLDAYRAECTDGWETAPNDGYFFEHLTYHLAESRSYDELHALLWTEDESGTSNSWFRAWEALGQRTGYLADVERAWDLSDHDLAQANGTENPRESLSLQIRYALFKSTLASLSANYRPELLVQCVEYSVLTVQEAIEISRLIPYRNGRENAIHGLSQLIGLSADEQSDLTSEAKELVKASERLSAETLAGTLLNLAPAIPVEYIRRAVSVCTDIYEKSPDVMLDEDDADFARCRYALQLSELVPYLPEEERDDVVKKSLDLALLFPRRLITFKRTLQNLVEHAEAADRERIVNEVRDLQGESTLLAKNQKPISSAPTATILKGELDAAKQVGDQQQVLLGVLMLMCHLPQTERDFLPDNVIDQLDPSKSNTQAFLDILPHLGSKGKSYVTAQLQQLEQVLAGEEKIRLQVGLLPYIGERETVVKTVLESIQEIANDITAEDTATRRSLTRSMEALAPYVTPQQLHFAVALLDQIKSGEWEMLIALEHLTDRLTEHELHIALELGFSEGARTNGGDSANHKERGLGEIFGTIFRSMNKTVRQKLLMGIARKHPKEAWPIVRAVDNEKERAGLLGAIWKELPEALRDEALGMVLDLKDDYTMCSTIKGIALNLTKDQAISALKTLPINGQSTWAAIGALCSLVPILPEPMGSEALQTCCNALPQMRNNWMIAQDVTERLAPFFNAEQLLLAAEAARNQAYILPSIRCICALLPRLSRSLQSELSREAYARADELQRKEDRAEAFQRIASVLTEPDLSRKALEEVCTEGWGTQELVRKLLTSENERDFEEAIAVALTAIKHRDEALETLVSTVTHILDPGIPSDLKKLKTVWTRTLHAIASKERTVFLRDLDKTFPIAIRLGGAGVMRSFFECIQKVQGWWP